MHIVLFTHPDFLGSQSMPRFARMLNEGMTVRGHTVEQWTASPSAFKLPGPRTGKKWLGYVDQYLLFPRNVRRRLKSTPADALFVFADHALGPWVTLVADRPHVIHCHDFLAQRSALGAIPENPTRWTGQRYQAYIRSGYQKGRHFISVSEKTRTDLHAFLKASAETSNVVYNGLNQSFQPQDVVATRCDLQARTGISLENGYLLHVGGNQWYKNRCGLIEIYDAWRQGGGRSLPLLLIGPAASDKLRAAREKSPFREEIHLLAGLDDAVVRAAYAGASAFLFPSLAEGFGWPIAEAMASGCPVITTGEAPMTEVAGDAALLIPRRPHDDHQAKTWAVESAKVLQRVLALSDNERREVIARGIANAQRFNADAALDRIEAIYRDVLAAQR